MIDLAFKNYISATYYKQRDAEIPDMDTEVLYKTITAVRLVAKAVEDYLLYISNPTESKEEYTKILVGSSHYGFIEYEASTANHTSRGSIDMKSIIILIHLRKLYENKS